MSIHRTTDPRPASARSAFAPLILVLTAAVALSSLGCAFGEIRLGNPFDREYTLDQAQHRYTTLVRFGDFERARDFVNEGERDDFLRRMKALDEARFTEFDSEIPELDAKKKTATIVVTYTVYTPAIPYELEVSETQVWSRDGMSNNWHVSSSFDGLQQLASK